MRLSRGVSSIEERKTEVQQYRSVFCCVFSVCWKVDYILPPENDPEKKRSKDELKSRVEWPTKWPKTIFSFSSFLRIAPLLHPNGLTPNPKIRCVSQQKKNLPRNFLMSCCCLSYIVVIIIVSCKYRSMCSGYLVVCVTRERAKRTASRRRR